MVPGAALGAVVLHEISVINPSLDAYFYRHCHSEFGYRVTPESELRTIDDKATWAEDFGIHLRQSKHTGRFHRTTRFNGSAQARHVKEATRGYQSLSPRHDTHHQNPNLRVCVRF